MSLGKVDIILQLGDKTLNCKYAVFWFSIAMSYGTMFSGGGGAEAYCPNIGLILFVPSPASLNSLSVCVCVGGGGVESGMLS